MLMEKCYCMYSAFGKVHKFSVTQGLTALIEHFWERFPPVAGEERPDVGEISQAGRW